MIRVANAPCSWGALEFASTVPPPAAPQVLDEMAAAGYVGTELGDWGFLPTDPAALSSELERRSLQLAGAFVPVALARSEAFDEGRERAVRTARLLAGWAGKVGRAGWPPIVVLSDDNATIPLRTERAGRIRPEDGLTAAEWDAFASRAEQIATAVRAECGLRTVFHHHCAGYVETAEEIDALLSRTSPSLLGLCLDTGHAVFGGGDALALLGRHRDRIWHIHFKDCEPAVAEMARERGWDYHTAVRHGVFCELGKGVVPFATIRDELKIGGYKGWIVVEQDVLPGLGTPLASARRNREFLRTLGL